MMSNMKESPSFTTEQVQSNRQQTIDKTNPTKNKTDSAEKAKSVCCLVYIPSTTGAFLYYRHN